MGRRRGQRGGMRLGSEGSQVVRGRQKESKGHQLGSAWLK